MEQGYTDLGEDQKRYRGLADESYGRARGSWQQADKYLGKVAGLYGDSVRDTDPYSTRDSCTNYGCAIPYASNYDESAVGCGCLFICPNFYLHQRPR